MPLAAQTLCAFAYTRSEFFYCSGETGYLVRS